MNEERLARIGKLLDQWDRLDDADIREILRLALEVLIDLTGK